MKTSVGRNSQQQFRAPQCSPLSGYKLLLLLQQCDFTFVRNYRLKWKRSALTSKFSISVDRITIHVQSQGASMFDVYCNDFKGVSLLWRCDSLWVSQKNPVIYWTQTRAHNVILFWAILIQSTTSHPICLGLFYINPPPPKHPGFPCGFLRSGHRTQKLQNMY
jgi:hypothetical protein